MEPNYIFLWIAVVALLIYYFVIPIVGFWDWISWWNGQLEQPGQNFPCLDMIGLAYKMNGANWVYDLYALNQRAFGTLTGDTEAEFIMTLLMTESSLVRPTATSIRPYNMCHSIAPTGRQFKWPDNVQDWRYLIGKWMGMSKTDIQELGVSGDMSKYEKYADPKTWEQSYTEENFLFQVWGFKWNSPLIIAFITQWAALPGGASVELYGGTLLTQMLDPQLGQIVLPGGWQGMLKVFLTKSQTRNIADVERYLFSSVAAAPKWYQHNKDAKKKCGFSNYAGLAGSVGMGAAGGAGAGAFIGSALPGLGTALGALIGGIFGALAGAAEGVPKVTSQCKP